MDRVQFWFFVLIVAFPALKWLAEKLGRVGSSIATEAQRRARGLEAEDADDEEWEVVYEDPQAALTTTPSAPPSAPNPFFDRFEAMLSPTTPGTSVPVPAMVQRASVPEPPPATGQPTSTLAARDARSRKVQDDANAAYNLDAVGNPSDAYDSGFRARRRSRGTTAGRLRRPSRERLRRAMIWKEILDAPLALREGPPGQSFS